MKKRLTLKAVNEAMQQQRNSHIEVSRCPCDWSWGKYWIFPPQTKKNGDPIVYNTLAELVKGQKITV